MNAKKHKVTFERTHDDGQDVYLDGVLIGSLERIDDTDNSRDIGILTTVYVTPKIWTFAAACGPEGEPFELPYAHDLDCGVPWKVVKPQVRAWIAHNLAVCPAVRRTGVSDERPVGGTRGYSGRKFVKLVASAECGSRP
jgi:hypothetical protein